jgi:hypothetical protein
MGKGTNKQKIVGGFVALPWKLLNSMAYKELTPSSAKALPYFLWKRYKSERGNKLYFTFSYKEGEKYGFALSTFFNVIRDLMEKGFIDPVEKGGLRGDGKSYNKFTLSERWWQYGEPEFKEISWEQFQPKN